MSRTTARENTFKLIFAKSLSRDGQEEVLNSCFDEVQIEEEAPLFSLCEDEADKDYIRLVFSGVCENKEEIEEKISANLKGWKIDRLSRVSVAVLKLAVFEMLYVDDVPQSVAINEAVELAKKYEDEKAGAFVNGVLGAIAREEK